jgi:hypothetical protein
LRDVLSAWFAAILEQSYYGGWIVWIVKRYLFELNFGEWLEDPWIYLATKICAY